jgi:hypothetical protein
MNKEKLKILSIVPTLNDILVEYEKAEKKFGKFASHHEGYAVILEELDELWELIKNNKNQDDEWKLKVRKEATQVAAMAFRFMVDLT